MDFRTQLHFVHGGYDSSPGRLPCVGSAQVCTLRAAYRTCLSTVPLSGHSDPNADEKTIIMAFYELIFLGIVLDTEKFESRLPLTNKRGDL